MPTPRNATAIDAWIAQEVYPGADPRYIRHPFLFSEPGVLYSEGTNFPLVISLRDKDGALIGLLLNGDLGRQRNTRHQNELRWRLANTAAHVPRLIVPFSALEAAQIERETVIPLEIRDDRREIIRHNVPDYDERDIVWTSRTLQGAVDSIYEEGRLPGRRDLHFSRRRSRSTETVHYMNVYAQRWRTVSRDTEGLYWNEARHWLGDSLFKAKVNGRYRTFVSSFDYNETIPLYFLAEIPPKAKATTVDDAILALAPPIVHAAMAQGREVKRQGDMFAIPTTLTTKDVKARTNGQLLRMQGVMGTDHCATQSYVGKGKVTYARGFLHHKPVGRVRDHLVCALGSEWHLMVPNAVPRRRRGITASRV